MIFVGSSIAQQWVKEMYLKKRKNLDFSLAFWLLASFFFVLAFTGGASRADAQSVVILWPVSIVLCGLGLQSLQREHILKYRTLICFLCGSLLIAAIYMLPLSPAAQGFFPGRALLAEISGQTGLSDTWRPLTLSPTNGGIGLVSLATPLAVVLLAMQLRQRELHRLLFCILGVGMLSVIFGLMQVIGGSDGPFYLYRITNVGSAVGIFANRNHSAVFLAALFPLLSIFASINTTDASQHEIRRLSAVGIGAVLVILIIITGSRAGLTLGAIGLGGAILLYQAPVDNHIKRSRGSTQNVSVVALVFAVGIFLLVSLAVVFSRDEAIERMFAQSAIGDTRGELWSAAIAILREQLPLGSGNGSFANLYQSKIPIELLKGNYANHVHNDYIELILTNGIFGLIFMATGLLWFLRQSTLVWCHRSKDSQSGKFNRAATFSIAIFFLASFFDYPLRVPIIMAVLSILVLWLTDLEEVPSANHLATKTAANVKRNQRKC